MMMVEKKDDASKGAVETEQEAAEVKKGTKKTMVAAEIDVVQSKKLLPVRKKAPATKPAGRGSRKHAKVSSRDIGIDISPPERACSDEKCPYHGSLSVRGIILDVQVVSHKMEHTVVVMRERRAFVKKYQRYEKRTSRYLAHLPSCIDVEVGDMVRIMECRPISKANSFVVIGRI